LRQAEQRPVSNVFIVMDDRPAKPASDAPQNGQCRDWPVMSQASHNDAAPYNSKTAAIKTGPPTRGG